MKRLALLLFLLCCPALAGFGQYKTRGGYPTMLRAAADSVDLRVLGKTTADESMFSTRDDSGSGTYVRNSAGILGADDLTAISVYNDGGTPLQTATLISPRHVLMAHHYTPANGSVLRFVTSSGAVVLRTLSSSSQIGATDLQVGILDSDVPNTLSFFKVATATDLAKLLPGTTLFFIDQTFKVHVAARIDNLSTYVNLGGNNGDTYLKDSLAPFYVDAIAGDSSHPIFAIIDGQIVLLATLHTITGGDPIAHDYAAVNTAMTSLGGGYQLTAFTSGYTH